MTPPNGCDVIPAAVGLCDRGTWSCVADHEDPKPCPVQTEMQEHRFVCTLRAHPPEVDHVWWLAAPVNTWIPLPLWTAETLTEDDWDNGKDALTSENGSEHGFDSGKVLAPETSVPGGASTPREPANPERTGADQ